MKLNLGCGKKKLKGYINVDMSAKCNPDYVWDVRNIPFPKWAEGADRIELDNLAEHIEPYKFIELINEFHRLLVVGGIVWIKVPHCVPKEPYWDSCFRDPTHINFFTASTFDYWDINSAMKRWQNFGRDYGIIPFKKVRERLQKPFYIVELEKI